MHPVHVKIFEREGLRNPQLTPVYEDRSTSFDTILLFCLLRKRSMIMRNVFGGLCYVLRSA
jgi:hypothetical protein